MLEKSISWLVSKVGKVYYSMSFRNGQIINGRPNYDCSSAIYYSLIDGGVLPSGTKIGNTDSLFGDLERNGWIQVTGPRQRGDVGIWGRRGASGGAAGHTVMWVNSSEIVHCAYGYNGMVITDHDWLWGLNGRPELTVYRYVGTNSPMSVNPTDQVVETGSYIRFDGTFIVNDVQLIGGVWQVRTDELCEGGFTWDDNGIPTEPLVEVDSDGYATVDQELAVGSRYKVPGKFRVLDVGYAENMWLALIEWNGLKFWVDLEDATEVGANDNGTPVPSPRPPSPPIDHPPTPPQPDPKPPTLPPEIPKPQDNKPEEEKSMSFDKDKQKVLPLQALPEEEYKKLLRGSRLELKEGWSPTVPDKYRLIVYLASGIGTPLVTVVFQMIAIFGGISADLAVQVIATVAAFFGTIAGLFGVSHFTKSK